MVTPLPAQLILADYTLDTVNFSLLVNGKTIPLEPKVYAVLEYLIQQYPHFVTLEQLHQQVWQGRVVSDTAVRRTISKLRQALADTDNANPRYIKSQMKRGYVLLISPTPAEGLVNNANIPVSANDLTAKPPKRYWLGPRRLFLSLLLFVSLGIGWYQFSANLASSNVSEAIVFADGSTLIDIPGEKVDVALSADGRYLAFTGSLNEQSGWQLFLHDRQSGQVIPLPTVGSHAVTTLSFIRDDSAIAYVDINGEQSSLYLLELTPEAKPQLLVDDKFALGNVLYTTKPERLIFNGSERQGENGYYYSYDFASGRVQQLTFSAASMIVDVGGTLSPDQQKMALVRYRGQHDQFRLQVYELASKQLLHETELEVRAIQLLWATEDLLLLLDQAGVAWKYQLSNQQLSQIQLGDKNRIRRLFLTTEQQLLAILRPAAERSYIEASWPDKQTQQLYRFNGRPHAMAYSQQSGKFWLTQQQDDQYQLLLYDAASQQQQEVFSRVESFKLLEQSPDQRYLLLKIRQSLWLLELASSELTAVTAQTQVVEAGFFTGEGQSILYTESNGGRWLVNRYHIAADVTERVSQNYRLFMPLGNDYLAIDPQGQFFRLDNSLQHITSQAARMMFDVPYQINTVGKNVVISNMQMANTYVWQFNADTPELSSQIYPRNQLDPRLSLSPDGSKVLYFKDQRSGDHIANLGKVF